VLSSPVDGLADRVMFRIADRNFGDHESLVVNHTVLGGALAGVRDLDTDFWLGSDPRRGIQVRSLRARREVTAHTTPGQIVPELRVAHVRGSVQPDWACATGSKSPPRRCNNAILRE
jgi:hypothetical protein